MENVNLGSNQLTSIKKNQTSEQLLDLPAGCGGGELIDDVQSCLVVRIACVYIDARLLVQVHTRRRLERGEKKQSSPSCFVLFFLNGTSTAILKSRYV